jgi:pimeloyl-ACP methyl ester carboxylesterase
MSRRSLAFSVIMLVGALVLAGSGGPPPATATRPSPETGERQELSIRLSFTGEVSKTPVSGRIIVGFHSDPSAAINNPDLIDPQPTFAWDVRGWKPGEAIVLDGRDAIRWHGDLGSLDGWYGVQATLKTNRKVRAADAAGNAVTAKSVVFIEKGRMCRPLDLLFDKPLGGTREFKETELVKLATIPSPLLTRFYGEPQAIQAAVVLPPSYVLQPERRYPSVYVMGGWGSSHTDVLSGEPQRRYGMTGFGEEKVFVFINGECASGYHVFCSSETNGPREETFFEELVPFIEKEYRVDRNPATRFLMGQSTGAWAGLWLLLERPDQFGGAYVGSPDPVDFTEFTGTNIYGRDANMFFDAAGKAKCFSFAKGPGGKPFRITLQDSVGLDRIAGWGEQMDSFDAAFSLRGADGRPLRLCDWDTGKVDPVVAASWRRHDLSLVVAGMSGPQFDALQGKIHIYVADGDPFMLERAVKAFQRVLAGRGLAADIRFLSNASHAVWNDELRKAIHEDMDHVVRSAGATARASKIGST